MLDDRFIKENLDAVKKNIADRFMKADADLVAALYDKRNELLKKLEDERRARNENAAAMKGKLEAAAREKLIAQGKRLKDAIASMEAEAEDVLADINFDFDQFSLTPKARELLQKHAAWLSAHPGYRLLIEGHCDDRGTTEYNLALGERRAAETLKFLAALGVGRARMKTVSYGEEMPLDPAETEEAQAKNRRAHFVVNSPK